MAVIYADTSDGVIFKNSALNFNTARSSATGIPTTGGASSSYFVRADYAASRRGGTVHYVARSFYAFDVSSITSVTAVTLKIYGSSDNGDGEGIIVLRSTAFGGNGASALAAADFNNIHGWDGSSAMSGQVTEYSSVYPTSLWNTSGYNGITLDQNSIGSVIESNNYLLLAVVDHKYDYLKASPPSPNHIGAYYSDESVSTKRPHLVITEGAGYGHEVNTVAAASIGKINTVATASIGKIITVD